MVFAGFDVVYRRVSSVALALGRAEITMNTSLQMAWSVELISVSVRRSCDDHMHGMR